VGNAVAHLHQRAAILHEQIAQAHSIAKRSTVDMSGVIATYQSLLATLYGDELPLAQLSDNSDVIFHAEGPGARHHAALSSLVAWLCDEAERRLRQLTVAALRLSGSAGEAASRDLQVLMNGVAPGSLYIGFSLGSAARDQAQDDKEHDPPVQLFDSEDVLGRARIAIGNLMLVPRFVREAELDAGIVEAINDPEQRDAALVAAYHLSPTGKRGVHTIEISAPRQAEPAASFTNRERVVLRDRAVRRPLLRTPKQGTFVGELREVDLDAYRFQLRGIDAIGSLRCALDGLTAELARKHIGKSVRVTGAYEVRADGRPSLMKVDEIVPYQSQGTLGL
jgi:hypothetical protein